MRSVIASEAISRRDFLGRVASLATAATFAPRLRAEEAKPNPPYLDIHTHLGQPWGNRDALTVDALLHWMDRSGVEQACVLPLVSPESYDYPISTDYVLEKTKPHRERLLPFCSLDPRTSEWSGVKRKKDLLTRYKDAGARGFGEHKCGTPVDDPRSLEIYHACGELGFPVLFHLDNIRNTDKPGLPGLAHALEQCPQTNFIGHANGFWASISGDATAADLGAYPKKPVAKGGALDALFDRYPNIYGDLSAGSGANAIMRDMEFGRAFVIRRADRLLFGTDYLAPGQVVPQIDLYRKLELPDDVRAKVFRGNARRLLGIQ
jgi:predicted TIM-barrel fold metal-dependent hydrolase